MITCDKCGGMSVDKIYIPSFELDGVQHPEFLRCACQECGYIWAEAPGITGKKK